MTRVGKKFGDKFPRDLRPASRLETKKEKEKKMAKDKEG